MCSACRHPVTNNLSIHRPTCSGCWPVQVPHEASELHQFGCNLVQQFAPAEVSGWGPATELRVEHWPEPVKLRHRDGVKWVQEVCSHPDLLQAIHLEGAPVYRDGKRVWSQPWDCDAFLSEQSAVRQKHGPTAKVLALQEHTLLVSVVHVHIYMQGRLCTTAPLQQQAVQQICGLNYQ